jgi:uracil-DNA glycosylase
MADIAGHSRGGDLVFVGIAPAKNPQYGKNGSSSRLLKWCEAVGLKEWDFANIHPREGMPPDFIALLKAIRGKKRVVALGGYASKYLTKLDVPHLKIDHPSGLNRNLNSATYVVEMLGRLRAYIED